MIAAPDTSQALGAKYDGDELAQKRRWIRAFEENKRDEQTESQQGRKYYHDKQWTDAELKKLQRRNQPVVTDNGIKRKIDFLVGVEQRMRRDPKAYPRTPKHEHDADTATAGVRYVADKASWEQVSSEAMHHGLVSGIGVGWVGIKRNGSTGELDVDIKVCDPARFIYDPRSTKPDFSDARWMGVDLWLDIDEAKEQNPDKADQLDNLIDKNRGALTAMPAESDQAEQWGDLEHRRVRIVEMYSKKVAAPYNVAVWHYCKFTGEVLLEGYVSPYQDQEGMPECPYVAWSPYVDEKGNRYGPIRSMKSIQDEINHRRSRFLHELNSRQTFSNRGGAVEDVDKLKQEINQPDGHLEFNGGEWGKDVGIVDRSAQLRGHFELLQESQARLENYGPNPGLIGRGGGIADQSGRAILAQRDAGMTELSPVFERHRDWKLRMYRAMWARIRQAWTAERWITVTDDERSTQFLPVNQYTMDPMSGQIAGNNVIAEIDVDIILDEGPDTMVMQEEMLQTLANLGEAAVGPLGKVLIELSNCPQKDRLIKILDQAAAPPPEVMEMQARLAKLEEMLAASKIDESRASVEGKRAATLKTLMEAFTPKQAPTDEFGMPMGPAPTPDLGLALAALQTFPVQYREPTILDQAEADGGQPLAMPGEEMGGEIMPGMPEDMSGMTGPPPMLPPEGQMMEPAYGL